VFYAGENRLVPAVDFRCVPSISERTADMGNVYKYYSSRFLLYSYLLFIYLVSSRPGHTFFVFKAAAYTSLVLNLDQLESEEDQSKDEQGRAEAACQKVDPVVLAASIKHTEQQMKEECRSRCTFFLPIFFLYFLVTNVLFLCSQPLLSMCRSTRHEL
jgi:hypothetical protein